MPPEGELIVNFLHFDLGTKNQGAVAIVNLSAQANVRLMDDVNFHAFQAGRQARFYGGLATQRPARIGIPSTARWHVVVDLGRYSGRVAAVHRSCHSPN